MTDPSTEIVFVDTNVLVYAHDASETARQPVAKATLAELWDRRAGALSTQVLQEFYVVATRKYDPPMPRPRRETSSTPTATGNSYRSMSLSSSPRHNSRNATPCRSGTPSSSKPPDARAQPGSSPKTSKPGDDSPACSSTIPSRQPPDRQPAIGDQLDSST